jgi:signal recognition particle receptor subunit beta
MPFVHYANREIIFKIVYFGPALSGKTTNLEKLHNLLPNQESRQFLTVPTANERTLFFDFLSTEEVIERNFKVRFHAYTVPGQVIYQEARKVVLRGVDGIVMVYDSQSVAQKANKMALEELVAFLRQQGFDPYNLPIHIQYNKRDLPLILPVSSIDAELNPWKAPYTEAVAIEGKGVLETFHSITQLTKDFIKRSEAGKKNLPPWLRD